MAGTQGFEPRYAAPEAAVLPLDDVPTDLYSSKGAAAKSRCLCRRVVHWNFNMLKRLRLGLLLGLCACAGRAVDWKALQPQGYVSDFAGVIDPASKAQLEAYAGTVEQSTGAQMALVTIASLEGEPIEDAANTIFRAWGVGQKG